MIVIFIELFALILFLFLSRKNLAQIFHVSKTSILKGLLLGLGYALFIFIAKQTHFGSSVINQFISGIKLQSFMLYLIYPLVIAIAEEFIFRYFIAKRLGVLLAALLFTALHWRPNFPTALFLPVFIFALSQSWLFNRVKTIIPPIITHLIVTYSLLFI